MSYDIYLKRDGETVHLRDAHLIQGGTYAMGGTTEAWLNVTYNYSTHYYRVFGEKGIRTIYGMTPADSIPVLLAAMGKLDASTVREDYWEATEGNAAKALRNLIIMATLGAEQAPDSVWDGD